MTDIEQVCVDQKHTTFHRVKWIDQAWYLDEVNRGPGGRSYSNFYMMRCVNCGKLRGFPEEAMLNAINGGWKIPEELLTK